MPLKSVSLPGGLVKRNHLHHRYQAQFTGLLTYILLSFSCPDSQLVAAKHQNHCLTVYNLVAQRPSIPVLNYAIFEELEQMMLMPMSVPGNLPLFRQ
ncbi:unnamed protein product [Protopolystoma xenopodis]|uniref:Uncharacterized protein n=1 Tax=Protopolystoma xenopodis TaxID=117903 RepID=A0A3S5CBB6_9PLAT|nr:unnamed protein product [Protopolystoma xenopodis]